MRGGDAVPFLRKRRHLAAEAEFNPAFAQFCVEDARHIVIEGQHDLLFHLDEGDAHAAAEQIFRRFQPDEPAADDEDGARLFLFEKIVDAEGILDRAQGENAVSSPRKGREYRLRARRVDELIVTLFVFRALFRADAHALAGAVYRDPASLFMRTSTLKRLRKLAGVCSVSLRLSEISPPI